MSKNVRTSPADTPIVGPAEDALGRSPSAKSFAEQLLSLDASHGLVAGVLGPWGAGKTSFINLARSELSKARITILDFNPWLFSGTEQILESFFGELSSQLRVRAGLDHIAAQLTEYGQALGGLAWVPFAGAWLGRFAALSKALKTLVGRRSVTATSRKERLRTALQRLGSPIVVVLDDIDRLTPPEVKEVFRLVRLVADFPNVIYLLAFDRFQVERALSPDGREYMEKILQLAVDLPSIPATLLREQLLDAIEGAVAGRDARFDNTAWVDVFYEVVLPFFRNVRHIRRFAVALRAAVDLIGAQVEMTDIVALESIRMFLPEVFERLHSVVPALTTASDSSVVQDPDSFKSTLQALVELGDPQQSVVSSFLRRIFPATQRHLSNVVYRTDKDWLRARRVAHRDVLLFYLERTGLTALGLAETAFGQMEDRKRFDDFIRSIKPSQLEDVISALEAFQSDFRPSHVVPGVIALQNIRSSLPARARRGMFDFGPDLVVGRVVLRLFWAIKDKAQLEDAIRSILPEIVSLSDRHDIIHTVADTDLGESLLPEHVIRELEKNWRGQVRAASPDALRGEHDLLRVLLAACTTQEDEEPVVIAEDSSLLVEILNSARSESLSQAGRSRALVRRPFLQWKALIRLFGSEDELKRRILSAGDEMEHEPELAALVGEYLSGRAKDPST